jgi:hypothetical protein
MQGLEDAGQVKTEAVAAGGAAVCRWCNYNGAGGDVFGALKASRGFSLVPGINALLPTGAQRGRGATHSRERQRLRSPRSQQVMPEKAGRQVIHLRRHTAHRMPI